MSTVYLAIQDSLNRQVALKIMSSHLDTDPSFRQRFLKEAKIAAMLTHANILSVHNVGYAGGHYFIAMEYIAGGNLKERIKQGLSFSQTIEIIKQIALALGFAHQRGFMHRDIKPANILLRTDGTPILADFGLARMVAGEEQTRLTLTGYTLGTPGYMSPEQVKGNQELDGRSDLYSLGIVFYEMLVGHIPFKAENSFAMALMHVTEPIPKLPEPLTSLQPVLNRLLAKTPNERFANSRELISTLEHSLSAAVGANDNIAQETLILPVAPSTAEQNPPEDAPENDPLTFKNWRRSAGVGLAALILAGVFAWWMQPPLGTEQHQRPPRVEVLLDQARNQLRAGRVLTPDNDNAYQTYQEILSIAPDDARAQDVLRQAINWVEDSVTQLLEDNDLEAGLALVEQGLSMDPKNSALNALRDTFEKRRKLAEEQRLIAEWLRQAEAHRAAERLVEPVDDSALYAYRQVLDIDPKNETALAGIRDIASRYEERARQANRVGDLERALAEIDTGLEADPTHTALLALQQAILDQQQTSRERNKQIAALLAKADDQMTRSRLTLPADDNAYQSYRAALALEPHNAEARAGLERIVHRYADMAKDRLQQDDASASLAYIERGLAINPNHVGLRELRTQARQTRAKFPSQPAHTGRPPETTPPPQLATEPANTSQPVGAVVRVDRNWGFVVFELDRAGAVTQGDPVYVKQPNQTWQRLIVSKIINRKASATTKGDLAAIEVGMAIFAE
jgi:predicted Ser/Thr protein kinase